MHNNNNCAKDLDSINKQQIFSTPKNIFKVIKRWKEAFFLFHPYAYGNDVIAVLWFAKQ